MPNYILMLHLCIDDAKNDWYVSGSTSTTPYLVLLKAEKEVSRRISGNLGRVYFRGRKLPSVDEHSRIYVIV